MSFAVLAACKGKEAGKQAPPTQGSAQGSGDARWVEKLPAVTAGDPQLLIQFAIGLVRIGADGSIAVATAPSAAPVDPRAPSDPFGAAKAVPLAGLGEALGLPPIVARPESAFGVIENAGSAGSGTAENPADIAFARLGHPVPAGGAPVPPKRATSAFALIHPNDVSGGVMVFADATASAGTLVDVLAQTGGFLAVRNGSKLGALPLALDRHAPAPNSPHKSWFEVRLGPTIELEAVPAKPIPVESIAKLGEVAKAAGATAVDLLVGPDTKVQDVVAAVEQLRAANIDAIGLGRAPGADTGKRGDQGPRVLAWDFYMADVDKTATEKFQAALDPTYEPMRECYRAALAKTPDLSGTAQLAVFVAANGKVSGADAAGVPSALIACAVTAAKAATFPTGGTAGAKVTAKLGFFPR